jgi:predicted RNase H-like nuclease (RuvC/YqgF family)
MLRPAINSTEDPPQPVEDLAMREYIFALRRRIEVQDCLVEALSEEIKQLKDERDGLKAQVESLLLDLHWMDSKRKIQTV